MAFNIAVASKYNPFTFEDYVKPLEDYTKNYREHEEALGKIQNDLAAVKSIIETAPDGTKEKADALALYDNLQKEAETLMSSGYTSVGRKSLLDLKNQYNSLIPRILTAEEALRQERKKYADIKRTNKFIMPDQENPTTFSWANYIDGALPEYSLGISKDEAYAAGARAGKTISARVVNDPIFGSARKGTYTTITQSRGLKYNTAEEMMEQNQNIAAEVENIFKGYDTEGWDEASKAALKQEIIKGAFEGLVYDSNTSYQRNPVASPQPKPMIFTDDNGRTVMITGGKTLLFNPDGTLVSDATLAAEKAAAKEEAVRATYSVPFQQTAFYVGDIYRNGKVLDPSTWKTANDNAATNPMQFIANLKQSYLAEANGSTAPTVRSDYTRPYNIAAHGTTALFGAYEKAVKSFTDKEQQNAFKKGMTVNDYMLFVQGGGYNPQLKPNSSGVTFSIGTEGAGDNHLVLVPTAVACANIIADAQLKYNDKIGILTNFQNAVINGSKQARQINNAIEKVAQLEFQKQLQNEINAEKKAPTLQSILKKPEIVTTLSYLSNDTILHLYEEVLNSNNLPLPKINTAKEEKEDQTKKEENIILNTGQHYSPYGETFSSVLPPTLQ